MRVGYSFFGFLGDHKIDSGGETIDAPDGNATYSWSLIWEMQQRGHTIYGMQDDRDWPAYKKWGDANFSSFSQQKRASAYRGLKPTFGSFTPELDVLLLEWRWPIPGRNCKIDMSDGMIRDVYVKDECQPDWIRQCDLIEHYKSKGTRIIVWDLDHKVTHEDERRLKPDAIFETSVTPLELTMKRTRVEPPFIISDLTEHPTLPQDPNRKLVYIGSRYERDDVITEWIKPVSDKLDRVEFYGNWIKTIEDCKKLWPNVFYNGRVTTKDFRSIYGDAVACPLLAKKSYLESGFITPRVWEALLFGTIPIGLGSAKGIEQYVDLVATDGLDMIEIVKMLSEADLKQRDEMRRANIAKLDFMDARHFVDKIENVI